MQNYSFIENLNNEEFREFPYNLNTDNSIVNNPENKEEIFQRFDEKFKEYQNKIIEPMEKKDRPNRNGQNKLYSNIKNILDKTLYSCYETDFLENLQKEKNVPDIEPAEFEERLEQMITERSKVLNASKELIGEVGFVESKEKPDESKKNLNDKILEKYNINCEELENNINKYEKAVYEVFTELSQMEEKISFYHKHINEVISWSKNMPNIFDEPNEPDNFSKINENIIAQLKKYMELNNYQNLLDEYKENYLLLSFLVSRNEYFLKKPNKCSICITNDITHTLSPCGHCYCFNCANKLTHNKCHICRTNTMRKIRLYM